MEQVILVDAKDQPIGTMEKLQTHKEGRLHRCFSILIFNQAGEILLQQRALNKYHTPGLWTNTCCSHQRPGEETLAAAHRRLVEEMGFDCALHEVYEFVYKVPFENGLWEHEFDHVLIGRYDGKVSPNSEEVNAYRWMSMDKLKQDMKDNPHHYTPWFHIILDEHYESIIAKIKKINF